MQIMVMNDDPAVQIRVTKGLMSKGFQVVGMETVERACAYVKLDPVDILIMGERVSGRLSHTVALAAECANPMVTTMLLTDRSDPEIEELYELLPSLYALVSPQSDPAVVSRLALSAVANPGEAEQRMRRNALARQMQPMADWAAVFQEKPPVTTVAAEADLIDLEDDAEDLIDLEDDAEEETATWGAEYAVFAMAGEVPEVATPSAQEPADFADAFADLIRQEAVAGAKVAERAEPGIAAAAPAAPTPVPSRIPMPLPEFLPQPKREPTPIASVRAEQIATAQAQRPLPPEISLSETAPEPFSDRTSAQPDRAAWIKAKVLELEGAESEVRSRLHLA